MYRLQRFKKCNDKATGFSSQFGGKIGAAEKKIRSPFRAYIEREKDIKLSTNKVSVKRFFT
jgi:hypothetical protein